MRDVTFLIGCSLHCRHFMSSFLVLPPTVWKEPLRDNNSKLSTRLLLIFSAWYHLRYCKTPHHGPFETKHPKRPQNHFLIPKKFDPPSPLDVKRIWEAVNSIAHSWAPFALMPKWAFVAESIHIKIPHFLDLWPGMIISIFAPKGGDYSWKANNSNISHRRSCPILF